MLEILSWCFSAVCMAIIIGVLWQYNGQQDLTLPFGLTINGFISLFSGFARSSLLLTTAELIGQLKWVSSVVFLVNDQISLTLLRTHSIRTRGVW
jgi:hypothetical protein